MDSLDTKRSPAEIARGDSLPAAPSLPPAAHPEASSTAADAAETIECWYFCGEGADMPSL